MLGIGRYVIKLIFSLMVIGCFSYFAWNVYSGDSAMQAAENTFKGIKKKVGMEAKTFVPLQPKELIAASRNASEWQLNVAKTFIIVGTYLWGSMTFVGYMLLSVFNVKNLLATMNIVGFFSSFVFTAMTFDTLIFVVNSCIAMFHGYFPAAGIITESSYIIVPFLKFVGILNDTNEATEFLTSHFSSIKHLDNRGNISPSGNATDTATSTSREGVRRRSGFLFGVFEVLKRLSIDSGIIEGRRESLPVPERE